MSLLVNNIGQLVTNDPDLGDGSPLGMLENAALVIVNGHVVWVGGVRDASAADQMIDVGGRAVIPGFVDSHSHLVFAGDRAAEFAARRTCERAGSNGTLAPVSASPYPRENAVLPSATTDTTAPGTRAPVRRPGRALSKNAARSADDAVGQDAAAAGPAAAAAAGPAATASRGSATVVRQVSATARHPVRVSLLMDPSVGRTPMSHHRRAVDGMLQPKS